MISELSDILKHNSSMIVELMIDPNHMTLPKASVYKTKDGLFATRPMEELQPFLPEEEFLSNMLVEKANCE